MKLPTRQRRRAEPPRCSTYGLVESGADRSVRLVSGGACAAVLHHPHAPSV